MRLASMQTAFRAWLHEGAGELPPGFCADALPGLRVYRNNYISQLFACLEASFPITRAWLGENAFRELSESHIQAVPPSTWTIDAYSAGFPDTLRAAYSDDPEVAELAWLEWALGEAFISPDEQPLSVDGLADIDWDKAVLLLSTSLAVADATTNAGAIWSALRLGNTPPAVQRLAVGSAFMVWRSGFESMFRTVDPLETRAIREVTGGASFAQLCDELVSSHGDQEGTEIAASLLARWIGDGLITGIKEAVRGGCRGTADLRSRGLIAG